MGSEAPEPKSVLLVINWLLIISTVDEIILPPLKQILPLVPYIDIDLPESALLKNQMMMLDILANNDWERPIYFTGGSYSDSEYIWMKKYLQLEGLVYKLVPIETDLGDENPYLMGRIDSDLMYDIVMQWEWGNSESLDIYHDTETRKNSISFRSNMARLAETLINENKFEKAKAILDLGIEKMPLDYFGYYSLLVPFVDGYYRINEVDKAKELSQKIGQKYYERLAYFNSLEANLQYNMGEEIITEIERYRALVEADLKHGEKTELTPVLNKFMESFMPFKFLYGDYEFYTGLIDIAEGYYLDGEIELAQDLASKISAEYDKRLGLYNQVSEDSQRQILERIQRELSSFNYAVQIVKAYDSTKFSDQIESMFNKNLNLFSSVLSEEE